MSNMKPSYTVHAERNDTIVNIPIYDVPELDKPVLQSALAAGANLTNNGWDNVDILPADGAE